MAEFFPPVLFEIKAKANEAIATFGTVNKELAKMEKNGLLAGGALGTLEKASKYAGVALLSLGGAFAAFGVSSIKVLDGVEKAQANLQTAVTNTGVSFKIAKPEIDAHAKSMTDLGFTVQDTYDALAKMTMASGSPRIALNSLATAADLARAKNMSLADAGTLVARASIGQAKGLGDLGIALGKTLPKGASMAQVLSAIEQRAHGAAAAFGDTLAGKIAIANAHFQELQIQVGTDLVPILIKFTTWLTDKAIPALQKMYKWVKDNTGVVKAIVAVLASLWAAPKIASLLTSLGTLATAFTGVGTAATEAAAAETAAFSVGVPEVLMAFLAAWGAYSLAKNVPSGVKTGVQNLGISGSTGGMYGGSTGGVAKPSSRVTMSYGSGATMQTLYALPGDVAKYQKQGWKVINPTPSIPTPSGIDPLTGHPYKVLPSTKSSKTSIKKMEKLAVGGSSSQTFNIYVDGSKASAKVGTQNQPLKKVG
jgi:hypothetical protein